MTLVQVDNSRLSFLNLLLELVMSRACNIPKFKQRRHLLVILIDMFLDAPKPSNLTINPSVIE